MSLSWLDFYGILPEIILLVAAAAALLVTVFSKNSNTYVYYCAQASLIIAAIVFVFAPKLGVFSIFQGGLQLDPLAHVLKASIYLSSFIVFLYSRAYVQQRDMPCGEYYVLALLSITGMSFLVEAHNLLVVYLSLELFSLPLYAMVAMRRSNTSCIEAALKYFVMGAAASGFILYGMSMYFGATGSLDVSVIAQHIAQLPVSFNLLLVLGLVFMIGGAYFKIGGVPFHLWVPDVYQGAPASVTLFLSAAPKIAAFGLIARLILATSQSISVDWQPIFIFIAVASMLVGNLVAIVQTNIKRMLAYSSVAHIGYMVLGLLTATVSGYQAALFYMLSYALMSLGGFGFIVLLSRSGFEAEHIDDLAGLNQRNPWLAFMVLLVMFSLAGIPPLIGFMAKLAVLEALIAAHFVWLAVLALLFAVVGSFYYIRIVKVMYFDKIENTAPVSFAATTRLTITINSLATLALGIFPSAILYFCHLTFR